MPVAGTIEAVLTADTRPLRQGEEEAENIFDQIQKNYQTLQTTLERGMELGRLEGADAIQQEIQFIENALDQVARQHDVSLDAEGVEQLQSRLSELRGQMNRTTRQSGQMAGGFNRASSSARQVGYSLNFIAQDAPYGFIGIANNTTELVEGLSLLRAEAQAGGKSMTQSLKSVFLGPLGIVTLVSVATSVVIAFGDDIARIFGQASEDVEELKDAFEDLVDVTSGLEAPSFDLTRATAEAVQGQVERMRQELRSGAFRTLQSELSRFFANVDRAGPEAGLTAVLGIQSFLENASQARRVLSGLGVDVQGILEQGAQTDATYDAVVSSLLNNRTALENLSGSAEAFISTLEEQIESQREAEQRQRFLNASLEDGEQIVRAATEQYTNLTNQLNRQVSLGGKTQESALQERVSFLEDALNKLGSIEGVEETAPGIAFLQGELVSLQERLSEVEDAERRTAEASVTLQERIYELTQGLEGLSTIAARRAELGALVEQFKETGGTSVQLADRIRTLSAEILRMQRTAEAAGKIEPADFDAGGAQSLLEFIQTRGEQLLQPTMLEDLDYSVTGDQLVKQMERAADAMRSEWEVVSDYIGNVTEESLTRAVGSASQQFGQEFADTLFSAFTGPDEATIASLEERRVGLQGQLDDLRESLRQGEISHQVYAARVKAIHAELAETNKQLAYETANVFEKVFRSISNLVKNVIKQVISDITAAIVRAAILRAISAAIGGPGGALIDAGTGGLPANVASIGPAGPAAALASPSQAAFSGGAPRVRPGALTLNVTGELRGRGQDLVAVVNTTEQANVRRGRS